MTKKRLVFRIVLAVGVTFVLDACRPGDNQELHGPRGNPGEPCVEREFAITAFPEDSVQPNEQCRLVDVAIASIAAAEPASGLAPSDTAAIRSALVVPLSHSTPEGQLITSSWHVTLSLAGREYDAEVIIDRSSGAVSASRIHKPF